MSNQTKFITTHKFRVQRAEKVRSESPEKISIFDREAYVEFFLLEDIVRLYEYRLNKEKSKVVETRSGEISKKRNIEKFTAIINIFKSVIEIAWGEITAGNYKAVWSSIPEHALMVAGNNLKYLPELRELSVKLLRRLSDEALNATEQTVVLDDSLDELESHEDNVRTIKGLPSAEQIEEIIKAVEEAIPDKKNNSKINLN